MKIAKMYIIWYNDTDENFEALYYIFQYFWILKVASKSESFKVIVT